MVGQLEDFEVSFMTSQFCHNGELSYGSIHPVVTHEVR